MNGEEWIAKERQNCFALTVAQIQLTRQYENGQNCYSRLAIKNRKKAQLMNLM